MIRQDHPTKGIWDWARKKIVDASVIADIGPGIRPQPFIKAQMHLCVEPHHEYADILAEKYPVIIGTALEIIPKLRGIETIFLLDVIEHMDRGAGFAVLEASKMAASKQVIVYTPNGFMPQKREVKDAWGLNGGYWQYHLSGWNPKDFPGWETEEDRTSFFAIFNK